MWRKEAEFMSGEFPEPQPDSWFSARERPKSWCLIGELSGRAALEIGACSGWISTLAEKDGATVVATDIFLSYMNRGLTKVRCLKEQLPFRADNFDRVLTANTLHHGELAPTTAEIYRVLKPGGVFVSLQEPCIPEDMDEEECLNTYCKEQLDAGIDERRPKLSQYKAAFGEFVSLLVYVMVGPILDPSKQSPLSAIRTSSFFGGIAIQAIK